MKYLFIVLLFCPLFIVNGQNEVAFKLYQQQNAQQQQTLYKKAPLKSAYSNNPIIGWDDDSPDGTGTGQNTGVGVTPIGSGVVPLVFMAVLYYIMKSRRNRVRNRC